MNRVLYQIGGADRRSFLQGLITNDMAALDGGALYAALLSPQGKYLADFFVIDRGDHYLLDVAEDIAAPLVQRLSMYRLRAEVAIEPSDLAVSRGRGAMPAGAVADPRHPALGWRHYAQTPTPGTDEGWDAIRVAHCIPESGIELIPNETYILEAGFDRLNGLDFRKGCYVGQEVTARMKHKTELRKGFVTVEIDGAAPVGSAITAEGKPAGTLFTQADGRAIAYLRFDRAKGEMTAGDASLRWIEG